MLGPEELKAILTPQFKHLGKSSNGMPLWTHAFTTWSIAAKIAKFVPRFNDQERRLIEITALIHDIGKMTEKNQAILSGEVEGAVRHTQTRDKIEAFFVENSLIEGLALSESDIDFIYHAHLHHNLPGDALKTAPPSMAVYADIIRYADWLASQERLNRNLIQRIANALGPFCKITTVQISRPEGPANYALFDIAGSIYEQSGWDVLAVFPDGIIMIARIGAAYPEKSELTVSFQKRITEKSLELQKPNPTNFAAVLLAGESAKDPQLYLQVHRDYLLDALGDFERAPSFFLKLLIDILDLSGKLTIAAKEHYPVLDILKGLCGTRGIPVARRKWQEMGGKKLAPLKEMLGEIFDSKTIKQVVPEEFLEFAETSELLRQAKPEHLYNILVEIADKTFLNKEDAGLTDEISSLVGMEEELDFRAIALSRFAKYKEYKASQNPERGICESCGSPAAFPTQKSLSFPGGKRWGFSQISAHTDSARATCTLCAYDTMMLRNNIVESKNPIYVRIESKSPDLWTLYAGISKLIQRLDEAFRNPYTLECLDKTNDYGFLPLPKEFKLPKMKEPKFASQPFSSIRGYIIQISDASSASPKDLRAKYMSLYALLKMMGFDAHIGFEEQSGLFGDKAIAKQGENYESFYYRGLAVLLLARLLDKEGNVFVFTESLLTKCPSVAITKIGNVVIDDKKLAEKRIDKEQLKKQLPDIITAFTRGNIIISKQKCGGNYSMKELFLDAKFFAEEVPNFIWTEPERNAWNEALKRKRSPSRHIIIKHISKAMNCILQGDDFETAFSRFLDIRDNISSDKTREESNAKFDVSDLEVFVKKAREVLYRYYELKNQDISSFIQTKNALLSSIYLLKRYPNIKEVVNG